MSLVNLKVPTHTGTETGTTVLADLKSDMTAIQTSNNDIETRQLVVDNAAAQVTADAATVAADKVTVIAAKNEAVATKLIASGIATAGAATTLTDTGATMGVNAHAGLLIKIYAVGGALKRAEAIVSNTATQWTFATGTAVVAGDTYQVYSLGQQSLSSVVAVQSDYGFAGNIMSPLVHIPFKRQNDEVALSGAQTFTRASTGTYIDPLDGLVKTAAINTPRFERMADGGTGILLEGASTNKNTYSEDLLQYSVSGTVALASNITVAPDGNTTADTMTVTNTFEPNVTKLVADGASVLGRTFTASVYAKGAVGTTCRIWLYDGAISEVGNFVDTAMDGTWQRLQVTGTFNTATSTSLAIRAQASGTITVGDVFELWGFQLEELPFASSYIPTTTTAVTRAADSSIALSPSGNFTRGDFSIVVGAEIKVGATFGMARLFGITGAGNNRLRTATGIAE